MSITTSATPKSYRIDQLPAAIKDEILAKETELTSMKSWRGALKLVASAVAVILGVGGILHCVFGSLIPWVYGVSIVTVGLGCAAFKKFWTERKDGAKDLEEWRECQADLGQGTPFRRFLDSGQKRELTWAKIQEAHKQFKQATSCIN
jgi:hypothetical protein